MRERKLVHFPVTFSMSLTTPPLSDILGISKGVMSQDLDVSLHCHCNFTVVVSEGEDLSSGGRILRTSITDAVGFRIERERVSKDFHIA
jgi:hypothetical protein